LESEHGVDQESQGPAKEVVEKSMGVVDEELTLELRRKIRIHRDSVFVVVV
jgi:hypothetical protein